MSPYALVASSDVDLLARSVRSGRQVAHAPGMRVVVFRPSKPRAKRLCGAITELGEGRRAHALQFLKSLDYELVPLLTPDAVHTFSPDWNPWQVPPAPLPSRRTQANKPRTQNCLIVFGGARERHLGVEPSKTYRTKVELNWQ